MLRRVAGAKKKALPARVTAFHEASKTLRFAYLEGKPFDMLGSNKVMPQDLVRSIDETANFLDAQKGGQPRLACAIIVEPLPAGVTAFYKVFKMRRLSHLDINSIDRLWNDKVMPRDLADKGTS